MPSIFVEKIEKMGKSKAYKEQKPAQQNASEPIVAYTSSKIDSDLVIGERDNMESAISGEELLNRLRPRIKALFILNLLSPA